VVKELELVSVSAERSTLAVVASENRKLKGSTGCSLSSRQRIILREWLTELTDSEGPDNELKKQFRAEKSERRRLQMEEVQNSQK
jgi:hypothetical protein